MLRGPGRGSSSSLRSLGGRPVDVAELQPSPTKSPGQPEGEYSGKAVMRNSGSGVLWRDPEAAEDNKKLELPSHRRRRPLLAMVLVAGVALICGLGLIIKYSNSALDTGIFPGGVSAIAGATVVEFTAPGLSLPVRDALNINLPIQGKEKMLHDADADDALKHGDDNLFFPAKAKKEKGKPVAKGEEKDSEESTGSTERRGLQAVASLEGIAGVGKGTAGGDGDEHARRDPDSGIRLLVAVTSACCSNIAAQRRAAVRRTWARLARERFPREIRINFFLTQPSTEAEYREWLPVIEEEVWKFNDTVILRGADTYANLPNKVFRTMRYALAHPAGYTHVLKTDDDTWVRMHRVLEALHGVDSIQKQLVQEAVAKTETRGERLKNKLNEKSKQSGRPIISDSMQLYDATKLVERAKIERTGDETVDTVDGTAVSVKELAGHAGIQITDADAEVDYTKNIDHNDNIEVEGQEKKASHKRKGTPGRKLTGITSSSTLTTVPLGRPRLQGVYLGCIENPAGFVPIRDPSSKWYLSQEDLPDDVVPWNVKYLAGWGYILSRDLVGHLVQKVNAYEQRPEEAPPWFSKLDWEDVLVGALLADVVSLPENHSGFRPPWRSCSPNTAVRHLDIDSPRLLGGLVEQDINGLADEKPVQCSSGDFLPGDYSEWKAWRDSLDAR